MSDRILAMVEDKFGRLEAIQTVHAEDIIELKADVKDIVKSLNQLKLLLAILAALTVAGKPLRELTETFKAVAEPLKAEQTR